MNQPLETVATFSFAPEMGLVRSKLESEGIECFVKGELISQTYIQSAVGGIKLQVKAEDAERARKLIDEMEVFAKPDERPSRMGAFDRVTGRMPLLKGMGLTTRFLAFLVLIAVLLTVVYMIAVL